MTKPPGSPNRPVGSSAPRCRLRQPAAAPAVAPLHGEHHEVEGVHRLDLDPAGAAPAHVVGRVEALTTTPSWPRATASAANAVARSTCPGSSASATASRGVSTAAAGWPRAPPGGRCPARPAGRARRGAARRRRTASAAPRPRRPPGRCGWRCATPVCWNGLGRPSSRSAISSPSRTADVSTGSAATASTTSGTRSVMSSSDRVNTVTWRRRVDLDPDAVELPLHRRRARCGPAPRRTVRAEPASIGLTPWPRVRVKRARACGPSRSAALATRARLPLTVTARRTSATGAPAAPATAVSTTDSSAPWRSPPRSRLVTNRCSSAVSRASSPANSVARAADDPVPDRSAARCRTASTSSRVTDATVRGRGSTVRWVSSMPVRRCRGAPDR